MSDDDYRVKLVGYSCVYVFRFGMSVIPLGENKRPMVKWAEFQDRRPKLREILDWSLGGMTGIALVTGEISGVAVIDCDSRENAKWWFRHGVKTPVMVKTKRGVHFYYRHPGERVKNASNVEIGAVKYDVRGDGGYVVLPPTRHSEGEYSWVGEMTDQSKLPMFNLAWRPNNDPRDKIITDGQKYIDKIHAISGQGGHSDTYRAAACLKDAGLSEAETVMAMSRWNETNAHPPWSDQELLHKVRSLYS